MLAIDQGMDAIGGLTGLQEQRIAVRPHGRIQRQHGVEGQRPRPRRVLSHQHQHALAEGLGLAARAALMVVNQVHIAMGHARPAAEGERGALHGRGLRLPGGA